LFAASAVVHYTTDGTNPTRSSPVYSTPIAVAGWWTPTTFRAFAVADGFDDSPPSIATYTIRGPCCSPRPMEIEPASGTYGNPVNVLMASSGAGETLCYTIDGSMPTCDAGHCTGSARTYSAGSAIPVDAPPGGGDLVVKALQCSAAT
jgi:hypothetical protein